jgi:hypothetical protein
MPLLAMIGELNPGDADTAGQMSGGVYRKILRRYGPGLSCEVAEEREEGGIQRQIQLLLHSLPVCVE